MLTANGISVKISKKSILQAVDLTIAPNEVLAVIGANGAGKSTLLNVLSNERKPNTGDVTLDGHPIEQIKGRALAQRRAVLPQSSSLSFGFTVLEIVLMGRTPHLNGIERPHDYEIAREALAWVEMNHMAENIYTTLSGGERQRVQLARVLAQIWEETDAGSRYLLMDEPTNNLDLTHQHQALHIANQLAQAGVGVMVILHDLNLASQYAQRIAVLHEGKKLIEGTPREVLTPDTIQQAFNLPVTISDHPHLDCPLVIAMPEMVTI